jgi:hypothetical protein
MTTGANAAPVSLVVHDPDPREVAKIIADALAQAAHPALVFAWAATDDTMELERTVACALRTRGRPGADALRTQVRGAPGARSTVDIIRFATLQGSNDTAFGVIMGRGCRPGRHWDTMVVRDTRPGEVLVAVASTDGAPGFPVAKTREGGGVAIDIRPFVAPVPRSPVPVALVYPACVCGPLATLASLCDFTPYALLERECIAWSLQCATRRVPVRASTQKVLRALVRPDPSHVQAIPAGCLCRNAQRSIGIDVTSGTVYGQAAAGLTSTPAVDEVLAKTGRLLGARRA